MKETEIKIAKRFENFQDSTSKRTMNPKFKNFQNNFNLHDLSVLCQLPNLEVVENNPDHMVSRIFDVLCNLSRRTT